jgi:PAS domain S-box-containing protein/putative nucleotidyltransferase with HDIG domain
LGLHEPCLITCEVGLEMGALGMTAGDKREILIVEDSKLQAAALTEILFRDGYKVLAAKDGVEGLQRLLETRPDLVISDVWMPNMNGYEFCRTVKDAGALRDIPLILLTTLSDTADIVKGLSAGADYYLTKPYDENLLLSTVASILANPRAQDNHNGRNTVEIESKGKTVKIAISPQQITNFLFSTYENLLHQKKNLLQAKNELKTLNDHLEERIREKTRSLELEVAEHKKARDALTESGAKYHAIMDEAFNAILLTDIDWNIIEANKKAERLLGYEKEEFVNMNVGKIYAERDIEKVVDVFQLIIHSGAGALNDVLVLRKDGRPVPVDMSWSTVEYAGRKIIQGILRDITDRKETERVLKLSNETLQRTLDGTVTALTTAVEMRDPYTAGHQLRVSKLASAIGRELEYSAERIEGLRVTGFLHDIGKIIVPAEILSKPSKLAEYEFSFIRVHSQAGYDILKGIEFPWPVATAVLQHHERLDGSGYPSGLRAEEIIDEARIIAVADVIESMASHRPYRPALGIETALDEIAGNKGVLYDDDVVDTALKLFSEERFKFEY